jgi:hypothetical protein
MPATSEMDNVAVREGSHWPEIIAAAQDPEFKPADFIRLILSEMSFVSRELRLTSEHSSLEFKIKPLQAEIQALRSMAETARSIPDLIAESDVVNLYGPKFDYVIGKFLNVVQTSIREVFQEGLQTTHVMNLVRSGWKKLLEENFPRDLNDPQVLMEYQEQERRKHEERKKNQAMYPPA